MVQINVNKQGYCFPAVQCPIPCHISALPLRVSSSLMHIVCGRGSRLVDHMRWGAEAIGTALRSVLQHGQVLGRASLQ